MKDQLKLYEFLYNDCTHESACETVSLHRTKEGAQKAMEKHKIEDKQRHYSMYKDGKETQKEWPYDWQYWGVKSIRVRE